MRTKLNRPSIFMVATFLWLLILGVSRAEQPTPNIIVILADDLGYGDIRANNPRSKIPTPAFDRLAREGVNFLDAHSGSSVCTPTRYGLLCGRYAWRTKLKRGVLGGYSLPLIRAGRQTIATVLKASGYRTACVGKWHLGLGWQPKEGSLEDADNYRESKLMGKIDFAQPLNDGPNEHGFDESYIISASLDMSPYVYIKNGRVTDSVDTVIDAEAFPGFFRKGEISADFQHDQALTHLMNQARAFITRESKTKAPFFLYFPMPAPHKPIVPERQFRNSTPIGVYGDFVHQVDWTIGQILEALDTNSAADGTILAENTLVIVTSDNGSFMKRLDTIDKPDHVENNGVQGYHAKNHTANGPLRGTKGDIWEAGHRVPMLVRWPNYAAAASTVSATVCLTDILATVADAAGSPFDRVSAEDSFSFLKHLTPATAKQLPPRPNVIHHSARGMFAIRDGHWKLIMGNGSGGRETPQGTPFQRPYQLMNLGSDFTETTNVIQQNSDIEKKLLKAFEKLAHGDQLEFPQQQP